MTFRADVRGHLLDASAGIVDFVGPRITPLPVKEGGDMPAITLTIPSDAPQTTLDGDDGGLNNITAQVDVWATTSDEAHALAELVRIRMQVAAATFRAVPGSMFDDYEPETRRHRVSRDFSCWYRTT